MEIMWLANIFARQPPRATKPLSALPSIVLRWFTAISAPSHSFLERVTKEYLSAANPEYGLSEPESAQGSFQD